MINTDEFDGKRPSGYVGFNAELLKPNTDYFIINLVGNCMNSNLSPIRIKDGDKILIRLIPITEFEIIKNMGKVVCFKLASGEIYTKQLVSYFCGCIVVKMFNPNETLFRIPIHEIKSLFVVDDVISPEYIKQNFQKS